LSNSLGRGWGEAATTEITRTRGTQGFPQNKHAAHAGGTVAGNARRELERKIGRKVVTSENDLALSHSVKKAKSMAKPAPPEKPGKPRTQSKRNAPS